MSVVDRMTIQDTYHLFPGAWEEVPFHGQKHFADVGKLRLLRWGESPVFSGWAQCNHRVLRRRQEGPSQKKGVCCPEQREVGRCYPAGFEDRGMGHEPKKAGGLWKLGKARKQSLLRASRRNAVLSTHFRLLTSRTCKIINLCCLKLLSVWSFIITAGQCPGFDAGNGARGTRDWAGGAVAGT